MRRVEALIMHGGLVGTEIEACTNFIGLYLIRSDDPVLKAQAGKSGFLFSVWRGADKRLG